MYVEDNSKAQIERNLVVCVLGPYWVSFHQQKSEECEKTALFSVLFIVAVVSTRSSRSMANGRRTIFPRRLTD
jgi:hypothetical protein